MIRITHDVSEQALAVHHDAVLFFVLSLAEIRQIDADGLSALLDLRPDAIDSAGALFERTGVTAACVVRSVGFSRLPICHRLSAGGDEAGQLV